MVGKNTEQGLKCLNDILGNPNATSQIRNTKAFGDVLEVRLPDGMGARWSADIANDPKNDYDLMAEILYEGNEVAMIRKKNGVYNLIVYSTNEDIQIPLSWLIKLVERLTQN